MPEIYSKPALTFSQQLDQLQQRGLIINDAQIAEKKLHSISYYRLSGYWYPFRARNPHGQLLNTFVPETTFDQVVQLYEFDRQLRSLVLDALERVEIALRTQVTYHIAHQYGPFGHTKSQNFHPNFKHQDWIAKLEEETKRSSDKFIRHYRQKYSGFPTVPIWLLSEVMTFGSLSFLYRGLRNQKKENVEDKKKIADHFNLHHKRLENWLHTLTYVRNVCAHHSRLWNRELAIRPDKVKDPLWLPPQTPRNDRIFYILLILQYLQREIGDGNDWAYEIENLIEPIATVPNYQIAMGLPEEWKEHPLWK
ncbi:Abi family protein [Microbulbifer sp. TRSA001]|uniref:Abi family protein n=1 Tax=Microbulbifer sp. TRSA001 TaxID=3243381 RepID=UPI0040395557